MWHLHFYVSTRPKYSIASSTHPFLRTYLTRIFSRILETNISSDLLDQNILSDPRHLNFFVSTWPEYSIGSSTPQFLRIYSTRIFYRILDTSISSDLLDQNILSDPRHLNFFVSTRPEYSIASLTPPSLCINSTKIFVRIRRHLNFYISSLPKYSFASRLQLEVCFLVSTKMMMNKQNRANTWQWTIHHISHSNFAKKACIKDLKLRTCRLETCKECCTRNLQMISNTRGRKQQNSKWISSWSDQSWH